MQSESIAGARQAGRGPAAEQLPAYAEPLAAFHRAHARELRAMIADLPLRPGDRALDLACGDGAYTLWLAERVGARGRVIALDRSAAFVELAATAVAASPCGRWVELRQGDAAALPFANESFDLAWCAQSMLSLPDPVAALRELHRVTRPGGAVAVFENDLLHQLLLPWPPELELAVRAAQLAARAAEENERGAIGRDLCALFAQAGLRDCRVAAYSTTRQAPLSPDELCFLQWHLDDLRERAGPHLDAAARSAFEALAAPGAEDGMPRRPDFTVTYLDLLAVGTKPC